MRAYLAFTKKELFELTKTYKLLLIVTVFLIFGFMNPVVAKFTPDLMESLMEEGIKISLPEPTIFDSWTQFFKNTTQMGLIILVIIFSGLISNELSKGTLINMLTKGLSRKTVVSWRFLRYCRFRHCTIFRRSWEFRKNWYCIEHCCFSLLLKHWASWSSHQDPVLS